MRQITRDAVTAFNNHTPFNRDNTRVETAGNATILRLHGHAIAKRENGYLYLNTCGWETTTTKERLNGVLELNNITRRIYQRNFEWFICGGGFNWSEKTPFPSNEWFKIED